MLSIVNEVDPLIFRCVCFVCDINMYFAYVLYAIQICIFPTGRTLSMDNGDRVSVDGWKLVVGFVNDSKGFEVAKVVMVGCMEPKV